MKASHLYAITIPLLVLAACTSTSNPINGTSSTPSVSSAAMQETKNVTYQGKLQVAGSSIFMEGTHKLQLEDGRFIMLESSDISLNTYVGKKVEVLGAVRPTVEAGGMIMRVEKVTSLEASSADMMEASSPGNESGMTGETITETGVIHIDEGVCRFQIRGKTTQISVSNEEVCNGYDGKAVEITGKMQSSDSVIAVMEVTSIHGLQIASSEMPTSSSVAPTVASSKPASSSQVTSSVAAVVSSAAATSSVPYEASVELTDKAAIMAKDNMAASFWTQQYCTKTAGYCLPIHKNWYFKSFGATSATLWHVEVGPQEINNIGEGPLSVNLVAGTVESAGGSDGQVKAENGGIVGYKAWTDSRHFEIRGPSNLQPAITFMISNLTAN